MIAENHRGGRERSATPMLDLPDLMVRAVLGYISSDEIPFVTTLKATSPMTLRAFHRLKVYFAIRFVENRLSLLRHMLGLFAPREPKHSSSFGSSFPLYPLGAKEDRQT